MSLLHRIRTIRSMRPGAVARKACGLLTRRLGALAEARRAALRDPFGAPEPDLRLDWACLPPADLVADEVDRLRPLAEKALERRFDLLGTGDVLWDATAPAPGFEGRVYAPDPAAARLPDCALAREVRIRSLIPAGFAPVAWHRDMRSGHAWAQAKWHAFQAYGHLPGVDIKLPWEAARAQHLVWFALLAAVAEGAERENWAAALRARLLDLIAATPPGFGVNWVCPMDVAIRGANMALALSLVQGAGVDWDRDFLGEVGANLRAMGRFIATHPEGQGDERANHFLADMTGLLFIARALPDDSETRSWWRLAADALQAETYRQFSPDGSNFESSTGYHRLSAEMLVYAWALMVREGESAPHDLPAHFTRIAAFTAAVTRPDGRIVQIGDQDDGRLFKVTPALRDGREDPLDHGHLALAVAGLAGGAAESLEGMLVAGMAGGALGQTQPMPVQGVIAPKAPASGLLVPWPAERLATIAYRHFPDFGLMVWSGSGVHLTFRAGGWDGPGTGAHAHADQLAITLYLDGDIWAEDPGSYVYTADLAARNRYRGFAAHALPPVGLGEIARLDGGPFRLAQTRASVVEAKSGEACAILDWGGRRVQRSLYLTSEGLVIDDRLDGRALVPARQVVDNPQGLRTYHGENAQFSPGYGRNDSFGPSSGSPHIRITKRHAR